MTTIDSNGIIRYEDSDGAPTPPVLNLGMQSVSAAIDNSVNRVRWQGSGAGRGVSIYTDRYDLSTGSRFQIGADGNVWVTRDGDTTRRQIPFATQTREYSASFSARTNHTISFNFTPNLFTVPPVVMTNIASGSGTAISWISRATNITATGFTLYLYAQDGVARAWSNIPVQWTATQTSV